MTEACPPNPSALASIDAALLNAAVACLRKADRCVLMPRYLDEKSVAEVRLTSGLSDSAAQKRPNRTIERLRKKLGVSKKHVGAMALGMFVRRQKQIDVSAHFTENMSQAITTAGTSAASPTVVAITQGVLNAMFWASVHVPGRLAGDAHRAEPRPPFTYIGGFSLGLPPEIGRTTSNPEGLSQQVKMLFLGTGTVGRESNPNIKNPHASLERGGAKHVDYESPCTGHEWGTWRRELYQYTPPWSQD